MSTVQTLADRIRVQNNVDIYQYPDTQLLQDFNIIYHQMEDFITSAIWEWYFWDILTATTTVVWQSEYTIPLISTWNFNWQPKVESVSIKYWTDYIKAREVNRQTLDYDLEWYTTNQSVADPIFFIADNSVFIYPAPLTAVANWIKFNWIKSLIDVTLTTSYSDLFWWKVPSKYFYLICDWVKQFIKEMQWKDNEAEQAKNIFEMEKLPKLVERLWNRKVWISVRGTPNLSIYK